LVSATVTYLPFSILKMWNLAPATSPFAVNDSGCPRIVLESFTLENAARSPARVSVPLPAAQALVAACA
jgi:hypothetical protein